MTIFFTLNDAMCHFHPQGCCQWAWFGQILMHFDAFHFSMFLMMVFLGASLNLPLSFWTINSIICFYVLGRNECEEILDSFYRAISCLELSGTSLQTQNKIRTLQLLQSIYLVGITFMFINFGWFMIINIGIEFQKIGFIFICPTSSSK